MIFSTASIGSCWPWRKPWTSTGLPRNLVTKKPYRGVNVFLLSASKYVSPFWLTFRNPLLKQVYDLFRYDLINVHCITPVVTFDGSQESRFRGPPSALVG